MADRPAGHHRVPEGFRAVGPHDVHEGRFATADPAAEHDAFMQVDAFHLGNSFVLKKIAKEFENNGPVFLVEVEARPVDGFAAQLHILQEGVVVIRGLGNPCPLWCGAVLLVFLVGIFGSHGSGFEGYEC